MLNLGYVRTPGGAKKGACSWGARAGPQLISGVGTNLLRAANYSEKRRRTGYWF